MSNKHKLLIVLPILSLFLAFFSFTPLAQAGICSDANQTKVPDGTQTMLEIAAFCSSKGGKPIVYERNNKRKCLDGYEIASAGSSAAAGIFASTEATNQWCSQNGHIGYDPEGKTRCDDGYNISQLRVNDAEDWCSKNGHIGYGYTPPTTTSGAEDTEAQDCTDASVADNTECNQIVVWLKKGINFLSAGVMIVVIGMIIIAGIQYSYAGGDPNGVAEAKKKITNAVLALFAYLFLYAFIQYLIPGGVF